ncbi:MAG: hypothetical protein D3920_05235 [Candidatus Electrothrix sp. AW2]|jgi:hypothetical protein|nr:hypothetical protein [Candidatus Electrothrix sp. AX1]MCI5118044.1 hypothetical protein [Candidatus Electrothrix gigas]MCI5127820.1 hypothetical protein [Candidatus Electrothrix gigas]MCI5134475.1 hypothetical protein [Candidatus Electrothrix gigas]MCI5178548.1 hypothetical protein [Candidatus Electrothrix gigas]
MEYHLISQGRLFTGAKEKECIVMLQRITKLSEEQVRKTLLNGRPRKLFSSDDKEKVKKFSQAYRKAGLVVEIKKIQ